MNKCKGGCQMKAGGKTCKKCGCDMEDEEYEKGEKEEKEMRSGGMACMKCGGKMHKSGGTVSSCMKCGGGKYTFGGKVNWSKKKVTSNSSEKYASGGMIKRADGSYSQRGLWDNIRANAGSGKEPTKQMLEQEKKIKQEMAVGGMVDYDCPPGMKRDPVKGCVSVWIYDNYGNKTPDNRPYMMNEIAGINKRENPIKYYEEGDPAGIKAKQMYADSLDMYNQSMHNIQNYKEQSIPTYKPIEKGSWMDMFYKNTGKNTPAGQFTSPKSQCNKDGVCIDVYPKPVQPIGFKNKTVSQPQIDPTQTVGYKMSELTKTPNTFNDRKELAKLYDFEKKTGRPFTGTSDDNVFLYEDILKEKEKKREENNRYYLELGDRTMNPIPEPAPRDNNEPEITLSQEPINTPVIKLGIIPTKDIYQKITDIPKGNETDEEILGKLKGKGLWRGAAGWVPLTDKEKIAFYKRGAEFKDLPEKDIKGPGHHSFGGAIKSYLNGGEVGVSSTNTDQEITLSKGAYNVEEPKYNANVISNERPTQMTDNAMQGTEQLNYKEAVQSFRKKGVDKSLPNFGYAKQEQMALNELIRKDIAAGNAKMDLLAEDDIIGEKTLGAMRAYEASGQYTRPEGFKDKWLAEYKKQWGEMQATGNTPKGPATTVPTPKSPAPKTAVEQPKKENSKTLIDSIYEYFQPPKKQPVVKDTSTKYTGVTSYGGYRYYKDKDGRDVVEIPDEDIPYDKEGKYDSKMADEIEKRLSKKGKNKVVKGSSSLSASSIMNGLQGYVDYAGNALGGFIDNAAEFVKNNQNKPAENKNTDNKIYTIKSKAASASAKKATSQNKSGSSVIKKYNAYGPNSSNFETPETEKEIFERQQYDNQRYGKFMSRGKDIANRTDNKRNADSESFFADYANPNSVIIDIGSALGNTNPSLAGVSVNELAKNQSIKKKGIKVIGTDIPSEVETFKMHQRNKQAYDIDYSEVPVTFNTPIDKILKSKKLDNKEDVYLRAANSIDLLMTPQETKEHFRHLANTLEDKNVTYVFNNVILKKPKGSLVFSKIGNVNNAAYDHNTTSWKSNTNRKPYTFNS